MLMRNYADIGIQVPVTLIPKNKIDLQKWSVVACDQYTSQPEYWEEVERLVGLDPSAYHLILPEAYLGTTKESLHQKSIPAKMREYIDGHLFFSSEGLIYIEREINGENRAGLIAALDLEHYDFSKESRSLIRATEGTILDRIPPRVRIREQAMLEIPHVMVLIDDPDFSVIEPLKTQKHNLTKLYDFDLMTDGGHICGYLVDDQRIEINIAEAFRNLLFDDLQENQDGQPSAKSPLLFAVGDGNHSLATAKTIWQQMKANAPAHHPARFAMVEIVNIHNPAINFEPIHRVLKGCEIDIWQAAVEYSHNNLDIHHFQDFESMSSAVMADKDNAQTIGVFNQHIYSTIQFTPTLHTLAVGNIQLFLDDLQSKYTALEIDFIHGTDTIKSLGMQNNHTGIFLPVMMKKQLFNSVINDGPLPRKTFSMGEANEKRYYLESRLIQDIRYEA